MVGGLSRLLVVRRPCLWSLSDVTAALPVRTLADNMDPEVRVRTRPV